MTKICITPPTALAVTLAQAKENLRMEASDTSMDGLITNWVEGVTAVLEHEIGHCIIAQTWRVVLDAFPSLPCWRIGYATADKHAVQIDLPHPVSAVTFVKYTDEAGAEQTLAPGAYKLSVDRYRSYLTPAVGAPWPVTLNDVGVVRVEVVCGYGTDASATPRNVRLYILAKLVEQFDPATRTERDTLQSVFIDRLLDACRSYQ